MASSVGIGKLEHVRETIPRACSHRRIPKGLNSGFRLKAGPAVSWQAHRLAQSQ